MFLIRVVKALKTYKLSYAIAGGYAVSLHGALRTTLNIDLIIPLELSEYQKAQRALNSLELYSKLPLEAEEVFNFRQEFIEKRSMHAWSFIGPASRLEMVSIVISEDLNEINTETMRIHKQGIEVTSLDDLIKMKSESSRIQDRLDANALESL